MPEYGRPCMLGSNEVAIVPSCDWSGKHIFQVPNEGMRHPQEFGRSCERNLQRGGLSPIETITKHSRLKHQCRWKI